METSIGGLLKDSNTGSELSQLTRCAQSFLHFGTASGSNDFAEEGGVLAY